MVARLSSSKLEDLADVIDSLHKTPKYSSQGVSMVRCVDLGYGPLNLDNTKSVDESVYLEYSRRYAPAKGDIIITRVGANFGVTSYVDETNFCLGQNTAAIVPKINPKYLYYILNSEKCRHQMSVLVAGAAQPTLSLKAIKALDIPRLGKELEDKIANVIGDINDKISVNQKTNQTLEQMAQALFKSWFVDFDPVFDNLLASVDFKLENLENRLPDELKQKAQRRLAALDSLENAAEIKASLIALAHELQAQTQAAEQVSEKAAETTVKANFNANPNILAQHANTHAHFPNEFEHNEQLGWIPKGWESKTIDELCKINPESWTKKNAPEVVKYVDLANAKNGAVGETIEYSFSEAPSRARRVLRPHDTIIGVVRPANRSFAYVNEESLTGSTGFAVVRANNQNCRSFAYFSLTNDDCIQEFTRIADGAAYPAIKPEDVAKTNCVYSNNKILDIFESSVGKFMTKVARNEQQNRYLTKLRDTLLPKLISGELQIPDVTTDEEIVD